MIQLVFRAIGALQAALGLAYLLAPDAFLHVIGQSTPAPDLHYPLAMLASRFLAYGAGFWLISSTPGSNMLWVRLMGAIQVIDFGAGIFFTATGVVPVSISGFPMFNAAIIGAFCLLWRPASKAGAQVS